MTFHFILSPVTVWIHIANNVPPALTLFWESLEWVKSCCAMQLKNCLAWCMLQPLRKQDSSVIKGIYKDRFSLDHWLSSFVIPTDAKFMTEDRKIQWNILSQQPQRQTFPLFCLFGPFFMKQNSYFIRNIVWIYILEI